MRGWRAAAVAGALLVACLPGDARAQGQGRSPGRPSPPVKSNPVQAGTGTIVVLVNDKLGAPLNVVATVSVTSTAPDDPHMTFPTQQGDQWVFTNLAPGAEYVVQAEAPGFQTSRQYVRLPNMDSAEQRVEFYLTPTGGRSGFGTPAGEVILAPRAQKEVQQGVKDLQANKIESAQKHLAKALAMAPANPLLNYLMGASWLQADDAEQAAPYLEKAISLDPKQTAALVALGKLRYQQGDMAKAVEVLERAVESAADSWQAHWLLAAALLRGGNDLQASKEAASALKYGKEKAEPARLIRAEALAKLGKKDEALKTFAEYLKRNPNDPHADQIRAIIAELKQPPAAPPAGRAPEAAAPAAPTAPALAVHPVTSPQAAGAPAVFSALAAMRAPPPPASLPAKQVWAPADVDAEQPVVIPGAKCNLPEILRRAGEKSADLAADLEKFSATEDYQAAEIGRNGQLERPEERQFSYLVFIRKIRPHIIHVDEMRVPDPAGLPESEPLMSSGLPALALVFHPDYAGDFEWKCEGMVEWRGEPAWVIHFQQRSDRRLSPISAFVNANAEYRLPLKGRAWLAANGDEVLHLVVDLREPVKQVELERQHLAVDYGLVTFRSSRVALWLPQTVDAYFRYRGHSYHQYSRFSHFELFWTATKEEIAPPKQASPKP